MPSCFYIFLVLVVAALAVAGFFLRKMHQARNYFKDQLNIRSLELEIEQSRLTDIQFEMAEKSLNLLEIKEKLELEEERSQKLLRNILPEQVIIDLRETGVSHPVHFDQVGVFFSDIVDFTSASAKMSPVELINELSDIFTGFDRIFVSHGCERIKTIGDAYMSVSGLSGSKGFLPNLLDAALEAREYLIARNREAKFVWLMRFGLHTGPVTGGIVGIEKYIYDIFGDTVNTASRMEKYSKPMKIQVSGRVMEETRRLFEYTPVGELEIKGKGTMETFFLEGRKKA